MSNPTPAQPRQLAKMKVGITFKPHQIEGIRWLIHSGSSIIGDDMGLGKTLESLTVIAANFERGIACRALIVTLGSLKPNWEEEIKKFTHFTYTTLHGTRQRREKQLAEFKSDIMIVHYEQIVMHHEALNAIGFQVIVYDEAHAINNYRSKRTKAVFKLKADLHYPMTGSPHPNSPMNVWPLIYRVAPEVYPNPWKFKNRYCAMGGYGGKQVIGVKNERELNKVLNQVMLRRLKKDTLDMDEPTDTPIWVDMLPDQRRMYDIIKSDKLEGMAAKLTPLEIENFTQRFVALKEICGSLGTVEGCPDHSAKLDAMFDNIEAILNGNKPTVVFTQFLKIFELITQRARAKGMDVWRINGAVKMDQRIPIVHEWTKASEAGQHGIMLCMYQVGGVGMNMQAASTVHMPDRLYVPDYNDQAIGRVHRIGQTEPVQVFRYLCRNSIDSRVEKINQMKTAMSAAVVEGDPTWKQLLIQAMLEEEE